MDVGFEVNFDDDIYILRKCVVGRTASQTVMVTSPKIHVVSPTDAAKVIQN